MSTQCRVYETIRCLSCQSVCPSKSPQQQTRRCTGWAKKRGHRLTTIILSIPNRFRIFFTVRFLGKFAVKCISKIQPLLAYVATLPCEMLMSANQAINDKLQDSVAAYLRCGGVVNNQNKKGLLLSLWVNFFFKLVNIWQSYKQERDCFMHFLSLLAVCWPSTQVHETTTYLPVLWQIFTD